jgi:hypothetical protein
MNNISIKHPKRVIAISVCVVIALCGAAIALLTANKDDDIVQANESANIIQASESDNIVHLKSGVGEPLWAYDPADISLVTENVDAIAKVKYTGEKRSFKNMNSFSVTTAYTVDVLEVLKGDIDEAQIEIMAAGGTVSLKEWNDNSIGDTKESSDEIKAMNDRELKASTIESVADFGVNLQDDDVAIAFLRYYEEGKYFIEFAGLSLFEQKPNGDYANPELSPVVIDMATINEIKAVNDLPISEETMNN